MKSLTKTMTKPDTLPFQARSDALQTDLLQTDARRYAAMLAGDLAALAPLLAEDLSYTHSSALTDDKASYLASLASGTVRYLAFEPGASRLRRHGELALLDGELVIHAIVAGSQRRLDNRYLAVWRLGSDGWQLLAWASTPKPAAG